MVAKNRTKRVCLLALIKRNTLVSSRNDWSWNPPKQPVLLLYFLLNQQALILPVHLINIRCQIWFAAGLVLTNGGLGGGRQTPQEPQPLPPPCCSVQPCLVSSNQSALIKPVSCTQVTPPSTERHASEDKPGCNRFIFTTRSYIHRRH